MAVCLEKCAADYYDYFVNHYLSSVLQIHMSGGRVLEADVVLLSHARQMRQEQMRLLRQVQKGLSHGC